MIVCSCNVLSDQDIRSAVEAERTRSTSKVYGCLGYSLQCGGCACTIRRIMDEALDAIRLCSLRSMARLARVVVPGLPHHVTQRGNGRQRGPKPKRRTGD